MLPTSKKLPIKLAVSACFMTSVAHAAVLEITDVNTPYTDDIYIGAETEYSGLKNSGVITNNSIVMTDYKPFDNTGIINTGLLDITQVQAKGIGGTINASEKFVYRGAPGNNFRQSLSAEVNTPLLEIIGTSQQTGLEVQTQDVIDSIDAVHVVSNGSRTMLAFEDGNSFDYSGTVTLSTIGGTQDARIEVGDQVGGTRAVLAEVISEQGKSNIQANQSSTVEVKKITVKDQATLELSAWGNNSNDTAEITLTEVHLEKDSVMNSIVYGESVQALSIKGDIKITMDSGASVDFTQVNQNAEAKFNASSLDVRVSDAHSGNQILLSETNSTLEAKRVRVTGLSSSNTGDTENDLMALADVVKYAVKDKQGDETTITVSDVVGVKIEQLGNDIYDGSTATVGSEGLENIQTKQNANVHGIAEMASLGLHIWRNEINDMNKRLGELRDSSADQNGVWARVYNGKAKFGNQDITNKYTSFQFGYDRQVTPGVWLGGAMSYTDGNNDFSRGDGDNNLYAFTGYGSWLSDSGLFLDVTGKIGRMKNSFDIGLDSGEMSSGEYKTNAVSMSAELGWRFYPVSNVFVEPQVEMMYGHVFDADYNTSTGVKVEHDSAETLIGRVGFVLGLDCPSDRGNAYIRASVLHDWKGEADYSFAKGTSRRSLSEDLGGTWYEYGLGANFNVTKQAHVYADVEASNGGEVDTDYRVNLGVRYSF